MNPVKNLMFYISVAVLVLVAPITVCAQLAPEGLTITSAGTRFVDVWNWTPEGWELEIEATGTPSVTVTINATRNSHPIKSVIARSYRSGSHNISIAQL